MEWENFGYRINEPCDICGKTGDNQLEPRYKYTVCIEHYKITPEEVSKVKRLKELASFEDRKMKNGRHNL